MCESMLFVHNAIHHIGAPRLLRLHRPPSVEGEKQRRVASSPKADQTSSMTMKPLWEPPPGATMRPAAPMRPGTSESWRVVLEAALQRK